MSIIHDDPSRREPIAIVGMGCRTSDARGPDGFWHLVRSGKDAISTIPDDRWDADSYHDPDHQAPGKMVTRWGSFLDDIDGFDWRAFGIPPREAKHADPQHRLLLEIAWEAVEDAGIPFERIAGRRGAVYVGIFTHDYEKLLGRQLDRIEGYTASGNTGAFAANRLSYFFDLTGPSVAVDATSASSALAVHLACRSIWTGEAEFALVGGVGLILTPDVHISMSRAGTLSPTGRCRTFDATADGIVMGEGAGVVVLEPLSQALANGDQVYAVVRGTATNHVGRAEWIMAPTVASQQAVVRDALARADIAPSEVDYVELHGTGTLKGDPIEARGLGSVVGSGRPAERPCRVGSVKTNIGHLNAAAGIMGFIKTALALHHREIPPSLHFHRANPQIDLPGLGLAVQTELTPWPEKPAGERIAGVTGIGFGGVTVHMVLSDIAPATVNQLDDHIDSPVTTGDDNRSGEASAEVIAASSRAASSRAASSRAAPYLLPISARSEQASRALAAAYRERSRPAGDRPGLADLCHAAGARRSHHGHRLAVLAHDHDDVVAGLDAFLDGRPHPRVAWGQRRDDRPLRLAFVFSGHGSQWVGMGREFLASEPVFRDQVERCDQLMREHVDWSLLDVLAAPASRSRLHEADVVQPALFAVAVGLTALWRSVGIVPDAVVGHSLGEIAAAHAAGSLTLEDAVRVVCHRGRLTRRKADGSGGVMVVALDAESVLRALEPHDGRLVIGGINSPSSTLVSGDLPALVELQEALKKQDILCKQVELPYASHSHHMDSLLDEFSQVIGDLDLTPSAIPIYSTVDRRFHDGTQLTAEYWTRNLRRPMHFLDAARALGADHDGFLEISPHPVLLSALAHGLSRREPSPLLLPSTRRSGDDRATFLSSAQRLYCAGRDLDWPTMLGSGQKSEHGAKSHPWVPLPSYPWQRQRLWLDAGPSSAPEEVARPDRHPLLGRKVEVAAPRGHFLWQTRLTLDQVPFFADHCVQDLVVLPAAAMIEMVLVAAEDIHGPSPWVLQHVDFERALILPDQGGKSVQVVFAPQDAALWRFRVFSRPATDSSGAAGHRDEPWSLHVSGTVEPVDRAFEPWSIDPSTMADHLPERFSSEQCYDELDDRGLIIGPRFRGVQELRRGNDESFSRIHLAASLAHQAPRYRFHPAALDPCLHVIGATGRKLGSKGFVARYFERIEVAGFAGPGFHVHARLRDLDSGSDPTGDMTIFDEAGDALWQLRGVRVHHLDDRENAARNPDDDWHYQLAWEAMPVPAGSSPGERGDEPAAQPPGSWLVLADRSGCASALERLIIGAGGVCVVAAPGPGDESRDDGRLSIEGGSLDGLQRAIERTAAHGAFRGVIHLWSLDAPSLSGVDDERLADVETLGCGAVMRVLQALQRYDGDSAPRLWSCTRGAQPIDVTRSGGAPRPDDPAVLQSPLWGFGRAAARELPEHWGGLHDLDPEASPEDSAAAIWRWIQRSPSEEQLGHRGDTTYRARLVRKARRQQSGQALRLRPDGAYLITGGLGGLGLVVARWLAERGARWLVLVGRTPLPGRTHWADELEHDGPQAGRIRAILAIEALGASVETRALDVADRERLRAFHGAYSRERRPAIRGVVHAAGVAPLGSIAEMTGQGLHEVLRPKLHGGLELHQLFGDTLDFFVLFSSNAAIVSSPRLAHYAAGNAFLDALAHHRRSRGQHALSVNWGPIGEVGLAVAHGARGPASLHGVELIDPWRAMEVLERLLEQDVTQETVWAIDWRAWARFYPRFSSAPLFAQLVPRSDDVGPAAAAAARSPQLDWADLAAATPEDKLAFLEDFCRGVLGEIMAIPRDQLETTTSLPGLGFDSLLASELQVRLEDELDADMPILQLIECANVAQLAARLLQRLSAPPAGSPGATSALATSAPLSGDPGPAGSPDDLGSDLSPEQLQELLDHLDELPAEQVDRLLELLGGQAENH